MVEIAFEVIKSWFNRLRECKEVRDLRKKGGIALVTLTRVEETSVNLLERDRLVPEMRVSTGRVLPGRILFGERTYYPSRIGGNGGLELPERSVQEVLGMRCEPLILVDSDGGIVAVYYAPGPEARPMTPEEAGLVAT